MHRVDGGDFLFITFRKWTAIYIVCLTMLMFVFAVVMSLGDAVPASSNATVNESLPTLIIDPGHGGEDGGAVGIDGTVESIINLEISQKAAEVAALIGWPVCMTRNADISIYDSGSNTLRQKKVSDMKNRVSFCDNIKNGFLISIHQNSLPEAKNVRGAQVFYCNEQMCLELANEVQSQLNHYFNAGREKQAKNIGSNSYLMKHVSCPAILVECGFLSNQEECKLLQTEEYQKELALVIIQTVYSALMN